MENALLVLIGIIVFVLIAVIGNKLRDEKREDLDTLKPEELPNEREQDRQERQNR